MDKRVAQLIDDLAASPAGESIDVRHYRDRIVSLHEQIESDEDRGFLFEAFFSLMATVERSAERQSQDPSRIRGLRDADHRLMLIKEAQLDGNVDPDLLARVTSREVAAGRLGPDDDFHVLAMDASKVMGRGQRLQRPEKTLWGKLFGRD